MSTFSQMDLRVERYSIDEIKSLKEKSIPVSQPKVLCQGPLLITIITNPIKRTLINRMTSKHQFIDAQ